MKNKKFVVLKGAIEENLCNVFFTSNHENPELSAEGEHWYDVVGYADTVEEAQEMIEAEYDSMGAALDQLKKILGSD